ncbi:MAG: DNA-directed RNA polymerase subunit A', partial [Promethearchaeota archaeon]
VTEWNIEEMKQFVINGPNKHPGANYIIRNDRHRIDLRYIKDLTLIADTIKPGFIVERHLIDGDLVLFNRQPSLHRMSIMAHKVKVMEGKTFRLSPLVCIPYNADFDGDEMNLHVPQGEEARAEADYLLKVQRHIISPKNGVAILGGVQDFISAACILTMPETLLDRKTTFQLLEWGNVFQNYPEFSLDHFRPVVTDLEPLYSGKNIFNIFLPYDLNVKQESMFYLASSRFRVNDGRESSIDKNRTVMVQNGHLISGILDKNTYGCNKASFLSKIAKQSGMDKAKQYIEDSSQMLLCFLQNFPITLGLDDLDFIRIQNKIKDLVKNAEKQCEIYIKAYINHNIKILPKRIGKTYQESLDLKIKEILDILKENVLSIIDKCIGNKNHLKIMTKSGAAGSFLNLNLMGGIIGQQMLRGQRINFGYYNRILPHFKINDITLQPRGFIRNSYYNGLNPIEFFMDAIIGRDKLVNKAVRVGITGYMQRRLVKAQLKILSNLSMEMI